MTNPYQPIERYLAELERARKEMQPDVGSPALPIGIPLRDWFAGMAIERMLSLCGDRDGGWDPAAIAAGCYAVADAMLAERGKP